MTPNSNIDTRLNLLPDQASKVRYPPGCPVLVIKNVELILSGVVSSCFIALSRDAMSDGVLYYEVVSINWRGEAERITASNNQIAFSLNCPVNISYCYFNSIERRRQHFSSQDQTTIYGVVKGIELLGDKSNNIDKVPSFVYTVESTLILDNGEETTCRHIGVDPEHLSFRPTIETPRKNTEDSSHESSVTDSCNSNAAQPRLTESSNSVQSNGQSSSSSQRAFDKCYILDSSAQCFQGDTEKFQNAYVPDYTCLMNFPRTIRWKKGVQDDSESMRHCVMCGSLRFSSNVEDHRDHETGASVFIPNQNKGICTSCDVKVWVIRQSGLEIKWCKGCKNFRPWAAFGEKGYATKCVRCRERQREKYALQKKESSTSSVKRKLDLIQSS